MLRKLSFLKSINKGSYFLIYTSQNRFATETPAQSTFNELYDHKWLEYDPTHKVFFEL